MLSVERERDGVPSSVSSSVVTSCGGRRRELFGVGDGWIESIVVNGWWRGMA